MSYRISGGLQGFLTPFSKANKSSGSSNQTSLQSTAGPSRFSVEQFFIKNVVIKRNFAHDPQWEINWRMILFKNTKTGLMLMAQEKIDLSILNTIGVYHHFNKLPKGSPDPVTEFNEVYGGSMPEHWITRGNYPGIWCALWDADNTASYYVEAKIEAQFQFYKGFKIFDPKLQAHQKLWSAWKRTNARKLNRWTNKKNSANESMADRIKNGDIFGSGTGGANDPDFFAKEGFGAMIGYSDYMALVILNPRAVWKITAPSK